MEHGMFTRKNMVGEWDIDLEKIIDLDDFFQDAMISKRNLVGDFFLEHVCPYIGNNDPNWLIHIFQRGWNHQPDNDGWIGFGSSSP